MEAQLESMMSVEVRLLTLQFVYVLQGAAYFLSVNTLKEEVPSIGLPPLTLVAIFRPRHHFNSANWVGGRGGRGQTEGPSKGEKEMEERGVDLAILDIWCSRRRAHTEWFSMSNLARESISRWGVSRVI